MLKYVHGECPNNTTTAINMLGLAIQMLAHDARRPFNLLRVVISKLRRSNSLLEMQSVCDQMLPQIERSIAHVEAMLQDILDYGNPGTSMPNEEICLSQIIESAVNQCAELTPPRNLTIETTFQISHLVIGDQHKLQRAFSNVIANALEASAPDGKVWVKVTDLGREIEVRIANSGSFIEAKDQERIFERFFTAGKTRGTGLGLAIAREVFESHGGSIICSSWRDLEFPGGMTEFICKLPVSRPPSVVAPCLSGDPSFIQTSSSPQILLVEDDPYIAEEWIDHFNGRVTVHVVDRPDLLRLKLKSQPDFFSTLALVVMDLYFRSSDVDGLILAAEIRNEWPQLPIYLSSDYGGRLDPKNTNISGRIDKLPSSLERHVHPIITM